MDPSSITITRLTWASDKAERTALLIVFALFQTAISTSTQADLFRISSRIGPDPIDSILCRKLCGRIWRAGPSATDRQV